MSNSDTPDSEPFPDFENAVRWFLFDGDRSEPAVPQLKERFGFTSVQACAVVREVSLRRARAT